MEVLTGNKASILFNQRMRTPRLGFIGFGEVTYHMIRGLKKEGVDQLLIYTRSVSEPAAFAGAKARAAGIGGVISQSLHELAEESDIIISSVRGHVALETAQRAAEFIKPGQIYVDLNNTAPSVKKAADGMISEKGAKFVDVGLLGLPIQVRHKALMYACGSGALEFKEMMGPYGMNIRVLDGDTGQAAMMKALVNIYMKCLQGVCLEFAISAGKAGIALNELEPLLTIPVADIPREKDAGFWMIRGALLAERKKEEMKDALSMYEEIEVDPVMLQAAIERLERVCAFHLDREFEAGMSVQDYGEMIGRMFALGEETHTEVR